MRQHALQRPFIELNDSVIETFGKTQPTSPGGLPGIFTQRVRANPGRFEQTAGQHRRQR